MNSYKTKLFLIRGPKQMIILLLAVGGSIPYPLNEFFATKKNEIVAFLFYFFIDVQRKYPDVENSESKVRRVLGQPSIIPY